MAIDTRSIGLYYKEQWDSTVITNDSSSTTDGRLYSPWAGPSDYWAGKDLFIGTKAQIELNDGTFMPAWPKLFKGATNESFSDMSMYSRVLFCTIGRFDEGHWHGDAKWLPADGDSFYLKYNLTTSTAAYSGTCHYQLTKVDSNFVGHGDSDYFIRRVDVVVFGSSKSVIIQLQPWAVDLVTHLEGYCTTLDSDNGLDAWDFTQTYVYRQEWRERLSYMFLDCVNLKEMVFTNKSFTAIKYMDHLFQGCTSLKKVEFKSCNLSTIEAFDNLFNGCTALEEVTFEDCDMSSITDLSYFCYNANKLKSFTLKNCILPASVNTSHMFDGCNELETIDFTGTNLVSTNMEYMFNNCNALILDITTLDYSLTTSLKYTFANCNHIPDFYIRLTSMPKVTTFEHAFEGCSTSDIHIWVDYLNQLTTMEAMFKSATSRKIIFEGSTMPELISMKDMFFGCMSGTIELCMLNAKKLTNVSRMFNACLNLKEVKINSCTFDALTSISGLLSNLSKLEKVNFGALNLPSVTNISNLFYNCYALNDPYLYSFKTPVATNASGMFYGCSGLTKVDFSEMNTSQITNMGDMFRDCTALKSLEYIKGLDTSSVTGMYGMFRRCTGLVDVIFPAWRTPKLKNISSMFNECSSLRSIDFSMIDTTYVTNIGGLFKECYNLKNVNISNFDTALVTTLDSMFSYCTSLEVLDVSNFDVSNVTNFNRMFERCHNLVNVYVNKNTDWNIIASNKSSDSMFLECEKILNWDGVTDITRANNMGGYFTGYDIYYRIDGDNVYYRSWPMYGYETLEHMDTDEKILNSPSNGRNVIIERDDDGEFRLRPDCRGVFFGATNAYFENIEFADWSYVTDIYKMFSNCSNLSNLPIYRSAPVTNMSHLFDGCRSLMSIDITNINVSLVTELVDVFKGCTLLEHATVPWASFSGVTDISGIFDGCRSLDDAQNIENLDVSKVTDTRRTFRGCFSLTGLNLSKWETSRVEYFDEMFSGCIYLDEILTLPNVDWNTSNVVSSTDMFKDCTNLPNWDGVTDVQRANSINWYFTKLPAMEIYYKIDGDDIYYCNVQLEGYELLPTMFPGSTGTLITNKNVIIVPREGKFYLRPNSQAIFSEISNTEINDLDKFDFSYCSDASFLFYGAYDVTQESFRQIENWDTSNITSMRGMFTLCSLTSPDLSNWDTSKVTNMSGMFNRCIYMSSVDTTGWDTSNVTDMSYMFYGDRGLQTLDLTGFDVSRVTRFNDMFANCTGLKTLWLGNSDRPAHTFFDTSFAVDLNNMFDNCTNLEHIYTEVHADWDRGTTYGWYMFRNCTKLPNWDGTTNITKANIDKKGYFDHVPINLYFRRTWQSNHYTISYCNSPKIGITEYEKWEHNQVHIHDWHYEYIFVPVDGKVVIPVDASYLFEQIFFYIGKTSIGGIQYIDTYYTEDFSYWFLNGDLTHVDFTYFDTHNAKTFSYMFAEAGFYNNSHTATGNIDLSSWDTSNLKDVSWMFNKTGDAQYGHGYNGDSPNWQGDVNLEGWDISNIENFKRMFGSARILGYVLAGDNADWSIEARPDADSSEMFYGAFNKKVKYAGAPTSQFNINWANTRTGESIMNTGYFYGEWEGRWLPQYLYEKDSTWRVIDIYYKVDDAWGKVDFFEKYE